MPEQLQDAFHRSVEEGDVRLRRTWPGLVATGLVGGIDVTVGLLGLLAVEAQTGSRLLGALAFGFGFIALTLANSELFTENFLIPVSTVVVGRRSILDLTRQWSTTLAANLVGGWVTIGLVVMAFPVLRPVVVPIGSRAAQLGTGREALASAMLAGLVITLMTWMERSTESVPAKLVAAFGSGFILAAAPLQHTVVMSVEAFGALQAGAPFGYRTWAGAAAWACLGNVIGGVGLVTVLRLVQVGHDEVEAVRAGSSEDSTGPTTTGE
jgi:formate/nitrite transporter FocA (FNT family)